MLSLLEKLTFWSSYQNEDQKTIRRIQDISEWIHNHNHNDFKRRIFRLRDIFMDRWKINSQGYEFLKMIDFATYEWENSEISFSLYDVRSKINPFTKENNIIMPVLLEIVSSTISASPKILFSTLQIDGDKNVVVLEKGKLILSQIDGPTKENQQKLRYYFVFFTKCRQDWMVDGGYCAEQQAIDEYFSTNHGLLFLSINLQQYNYETLQFEEIKKTESFAFEEVSPFHAQVILQKQNTTIDNGILFSNFESFEVIKDFRVNTQTISSKFAEKTVLSADGSKLEFDSLCSFGFKIDNKLGVEVIMMPKLGEVLAQIGSIVNVIMLLKIFSNLINTTMLESTLLDEIIEIYYPQFKQNQESSLQRCRNQDENFLTQIQTIIGYCKNQVHLQQSDIRIISDLIDFNTLDRNGKYKNIFKIGEDLQFLDSDRLSNSPKRKNLKSLHYSIKNFHFHSDYY